MAVVAILAESFAGASFTITDDILGFGPDALRTKTLRNVASGESFQVTWESGGKTESLRLRSAVTGKVRDVLQTHDNNATAVRVNEHYAGNVLLPFANRIAGGSYNFFGSSHQLPQNECQDGLRCDALHGFLFNRSMRVLRNETGGNFAALTLGYEFDGTSTPGWPFKASVELTYRLEAPSTAGPGVATIRTRVTNVETSTSLPFFNGWHPYFRVADVSAARLRFDPCGSPVGATAWRHVTMGKGAPRKGDLIPTGRTSAWNASHTIGGTAQRPTYMDDEFVSTAAWDDKRQCPSPMTEQWIIDQGGEGDTIALFADRQHRVLQIFTGAKEGWGWDAIALEPMSGLADAYNNGNGLHVLAAGETFDGTFGVTLR